MSTLWPRCRPGFLGEFGGQIRVGTTPMRAYSRTQPEQTPLPGHTPQHMRPTFDKLQVRADYQFLDCARDEHLTRLCERRHACADVHGNSPHIVVEHLALTGV